MTDTPHDCNATHDEAHDKLVEGFVDTALDTLAEQGKAHNLCPAAIDAEVVIKVLNNMASNCPTPDEFIKLLCMVLPPATGILITSLEYQLAGGLVDVDTVEGMPAPSSDESVH
jgi:hypothetical protein